MNATEVAGCKLRVASYFPPTVYYKEDFKRKRNPQLLLVYVFCNVYIVYLYM